MSSKSNIYYLICTYITQTCNITKMTKYHMELELVQVCVIKILKHTVKTTRPCYKSTIARLFFSGTNAVMGNKPDSGNRIKVYHQDPSFSSSMQ